MSALYVNCPHCGPLLSFIPQGGTFNINIQCHCGAVVQHNEKPVHKKTVFTKNETRGRVNKISEFPELSQTCRKGFE